MNYHFTSDSMTEIFSDEIMNKVALAVRGFLVGIIEDSGRNCNWGNEIPLNQTDIELNIRSEN